MSVRHQRKGWGRIINNFPPLTCFILAAVEHTATLKTVLANFRLKTVQANFRLKTVLQGNVDFKKAQIQQIACNWKILAGICLDHKFALHQKLVIDFCVTAQSALLKEPKLENGYK